MGEARRKALAVRHEGGGGEQPPLVVDTLGGRMHVRWDEAAAATPHGQPYFPQVVRRICAQFPGCSAEG